MTCGNDDDDQGGSDNQDEFDVDMTPGPGLEREPEVEDLGIYEKPLVSVSGTMVF